jgi:ribosomal protein S18 acetylase RimI-like enzyme
MLNMAVDRIRTYAGMRQVQLAVGATQTAAERMYQSLGFETFGLERDAINTGGEFVDEYWMVLRL